MLSMEWYIVLEDLLVYLKEGMVIAIEPMINMGNRVIFGDMAIYTMCKNNTFNGMPLPSIFSLKENGDLEEISSFGYEDFKVRLGK